MSHQQLERLKKDSNELNHYIQRMKKKGREDMVHKLMKKQAFLDQILEEQLA